MMTFVSQKNPTNKRQVVARTSSRSKKAGGGFVSIASTMTTNLVVLAFMLLLAVSPTSSLAESTNDALEIGDTHAILEQSKSVVGDIQYEKTHRTNNGLEGIPVETLSNMERIVDSSRITIGRAVGEDVIATTTNDSIDPRNAAIATPPLSSQSIRNLYNIRTSESLSTPYGTFNSNTGSNGNLFQVNAINCVIIRAMHVNSYASSGTASATFIVYKRSGALLPGDATDSTLWPLGDRTTDITLLHSGQLSPLPEGAFTAIHMDAGTSVSLHVVRTDGGDIGCTNGTAVGNIAAKDNNIEILEGYGNDYFFKSTRSPEVWNGMIEYDQCSNSPSVSPSPSVTPSDQPSVSPSVTPLSSDDRSSAVKAVGASSFALVLATLFLM